MIQPDDRQLTARQRFLLSLGEADPLQRVRELQEQALDELGDTRCIGAATCPFFHSRSEQLYPGAVKAPWDELKDQNPSD